MKVFTSTLLLIVLVSMAIAGENKEQPPTMKEVLESDNSDLWSWGAKYQAEARTRMRMAEQKPFSSSRSGEIDEDKRLEFKRARYKRRVAETEKLIQKVLEEMDQDSDSIVTTAEAQGVLGSLQTLRLEHENINSFGYLYGRHKIFIKYFDLNNDLFLSDVEHNVGVAFERHAWKNSANNKKAVEFKIKWYR